MSLIGVKSSSQASQAPVQGRRTRGGRWVKLWAGDRVVEVVRSPGAGDDPRGGEDESPPGEVDPLEPGEAESKARSEVVPEAEEEEPGDEAGARDTPQLDLLG